MHVKLMVSCLTEKDKEIQSQKTGNEISGRDRGYTHEEIQQILQFSDQRVKTAFQKLIMAVSQE